MEQNRKEDYEELAKQLVDFILGEVGIKKGTFEDVCLNPRKYYDAYFIPSYGEQYYYFDPIVGDIQTRFVRTEKIDFANTTCANSFRITEREEWNV